MYKITNGYSLICIITTTTSRGVICRISEAFYIRKLSKEISVEAKELRWTWTRDIRRHVGNRRRHCAGAQCVAEPRAPSPLPRPRFHTPAHRCPVSPLTLLPSSSHTFTVSYLSAHPLHFITNKIHIRHFRHVNEVPIKISTQLNHRLNVKQMSPWNLSNNAYEYNKTKNKYINSVFWDIKYKIPLCLDINSCYVITLTNEKIKLN